jgi:predicted nucleic acid-binding Zn ribbon protein
MTQVFSPAGVVFKGSGFYRNDSRPAPPKPKPEKKEKKKETTNDL